MPNPDFLPIWYSMLKQWWSSIWDFQFYNSHPLWEIFHGCCVLSESSKKILTALPLLKRFNFRIKRFWDRFKHVSAHCYCTRDRIFDLAINWFKFYIPFSYSFAFTVIFYAANSSVAGVIQLVSHFIVAAVRVMCRFIKCTCVEQSTQNDGINAIASWMCRCLRYIFQ